MQIPVHQRKKILGQKMKWTQVQPQRRMNLLRSLMTYHTKPAKTRNKESFSLIGPTFLRKFIILVYFDKAIPSCARKYTVFSATVIALSSKTKCTAVNALALEQTIL
jgi:hypothetical protein